MNQKMKLRLLFNYNLINFFQLIDPSLKGKIIIKTDKKSKKDLEFNEDLEADNSEENEEHDDLDVEDLVSQHLENLDELKLVISFNIISNINVNIQDDCVEKFRNKTRKLDKKSNEEDPNMEKVLIVFKNCFNFHFSLLILIQRLSIFFLKLVNF